MRGPLLLICLALAACSPRPTASGPPVPLPAVSPEASVVRTAEEARAAAVEHLRERGVLHMHVADGAEVREAPGAWYVTIPYEGVALPPSVTLQVGKATGAVEIIPAR